MSKVRVVAATLSTMILLVGVAAARPVRVATFNVNDGVGAPNTTAYSAVKEVLRRIDADIVAFQELPRADSNNWATLAIELGYSNRASGMYGPFSGNLRVGYYSRYPFLTLHSVTSPPGAYELTRAPLRVVLDVPGAAKPLALWTMHHKAYTDSTNSFRRSIEALRITQDMDNYRQQYPLSDEFVFMGDCNDDVARSDQVTNILALPSGLPSGYVLGSDVTFPVAYKAFPTDRYSAGGGGLQMLTAQQQGTTNPATYRWLNSQCDYVFVSTSLMAGTWGNVTAEVYNSVWDIGTGGMAKTGSPLPSNTSASASDHYPIFADLFMADCMTTNLDIQPNSVFSSIGIAGGSFLPSNMVFSITNLIAEPIIWSVVSSEPWFDVTPTGGTLQAGESTAVVATINNAASTLSAGNYGGILFVTDLTGNQMYYRQVALRVLAQAYLTVSPGDALTSKGWPGSPFSPTGIVYAISNSGEVAMNWGATSTADWITISPSIGLLDALSSTSVWVSINANASALSAGLHSATNAFTNLTSGLGSRTRTTTLKIFGGTTIYICATSGDDANSGTSWTQAKQTIQAGIDAAEKTVIVTNGIYNTGRRVPSGQSACHTRVVIDESITVQSVNGPDYTFIVGQGPLGTSATRCVWMSSNTLLSGFTLTNGFTITQGGGSSDYSGGGIYAVTTNSSVISNCVVSGCSALYFGGGAYYGRLNNCILSGNSASSEGGGAFHSALHECMLTGNSAHGGGGVSDSILFNCGVVGNSAGSTGGGAYESTLKNCTISGNSASYYGGGSYYGTLENCIIYYNSSTLQSNSYWDTLNFCCTTPMPSSGFGNITNEPDFVDRMAGNYRLQSNSPCIDAGLTNDLNRDIEGAPRPLDGNNDGIAAPDMGAYEFMNADGDSDGDDYRDGAEQVAGTSPIDPDSHLDLQMAAATVDGEVLRWMGVAGRYYTVMNTTNLLEGPWTNLEGYVDIPGLSGPVVVTNPPSTTPHNYLRLVVHQ